MIFNVNHVSLQVAVDVPMSVWVAVDVVDGSCNGVVWVAAEKNWFDIEYKILSLGYW